MDAPGPWGTGPFVLSSGYSSIYNVQAIIDTNPFASNWLTVEEERTPNVCLQANNDYWDPDRGPWLDQVIFRNDLSPEDALHLCTTTDGKVDIVTEVAPENARKVVVSNHAKLVNVKGKQILAGVFNRYQQDVNFADRRMRLAFNLAVDRDKLIEEGLYGYAKQVPALTPSWAFDYPEDLSPRPYDPLHARQLLKAAGWPEGRVLQIAATQKYSRLVYVIASQIQESLQIQVNVIVIPPEQEVQWKRIVAEKKLLPSWDILIASATTLFYEGTPAFFHREFFGSDGALRAGPELPGFNDVYEKMVAKTDVEELLEAAKDVDRYVYEEALGLFLCSPQDLYAVNKHVNFRPYRTSFELAETYVNPTHWSRH